MRLAGREKRLVGDGIELRRHDRRNYPLYAQWYADPEVWRLTSWTASPPSPHDVERLFEDREFSSTEDSFAIYPGDRNDPVGVVSLMNISSANGSAELSIILGRPEDRDRGYGREAIRTILDYGFGERGLHRVGLSVFAFNEAAIALYRKLGFREEGRLREALKRDGTFHDAILMSVLAREWRRGS